MNKSFLVTFVLPTPLSQEFIDLIPENRKIVNKLMMERKITLFALAEDQSKAWAIIMADAQEEVRSIVARFPLIDMMTMELSELSWMNAPVFAPAISLN